MRIESILTIALAVNATVDEAIPLRSARFLDVCCPTARVPTERARCPRSARADRAQPSPRPFELNRQHPNGCGNDHHGRPWQHDHRNADRQQHTAPNEHGNPTQRAHHGRSFHARSTVLEPTGSLQTVRFLRHGTRQQPTIASSRSRPVIKLRNIRKIARAPGSTLVADQILTSDESRRYTAVRTRHCALVDLGQRHAAHHDVLSAGRVQ
jgi:hypothetical protein